MTLLFTTALCTKTSTLMGTPQDPRARRREKARRARKNAAYDVKKAAEAATSLERPKPAAAVVKSGK
jgi:hypothetical protein